MSKISSNMTFVYLSAVIGVFLGILPWFLFGPETFWQKLFMFGFEIFWFCLLGFIWFIINAIVDQNS